MSSGAVVANASQFTKDQGYLHGKELYQQLYHDQSLQPYDLAGLAVATFCLATDAVNQRVLRPSPILTPLREIAVAAKQGSYTYEICRLFLENRHLAYNHAALDLLQRSPTFKDIFKHLISPRAYAAFSDAHHLSDDPQAISNTPASYPTDQTRRDQWNQFFTSLFKDEKALRSDTAKYLVINGDSYFEHVGSLKNHCNYAIEAGLDPTSPETRYIFARLIENSVIQELKRECRNLAKQFYQIGSENEKNSSAKINFLPQENPELTGAMNSLQKILRLVGYCRAINLESKELSSHLVPAERSSDLDFFDVILFLEPSKLEAPFKKNTYLSRLATEAFTCLKARDFEELKRIIKFTGLCNPEIVTARDMSQAGADPVYRELFGDARIIVAYCAGYLPAGSLTHHVKNMSRQDREELMRQYHKGEEALIKIAALGNDNIIEDPRLAMIVRPMMGELNPQNARHILLPEERKEAKAAAEREKFAADLAICQNAVGKIFKDGEAEKIILEVKRRADQRGGKERFIVNVQISDRDKVKYKTFEVGSIAKFISEGQWKEISTKQ